MRWFALLFLLLLTGCSSEAVDTPEQQVMSAWGRVLTIARTPQLHAPAFWSTNDVSAFAWVESDAAGVHQDVRFLNEKGLTTPIALPLSPIRPDQLTLRRTASDDSVLFYLDADPSGETRLYSAVFGLDQQLKAGPTLLSNTRTESYIVLYDPDDTTWVIWTGGLPTEPTLYAQELDSLGRTRPPQVLTSGVSFPTSGENSNGASVIYWLSSTTSQVYYARFDRGQITDIRPLTSSIRLETGERLLSFSAAQDSTYGYLFWNTVKADGTPRTWFTSGALATETWASPVLFGINPGETADFVTGYNGGMGFSAQTGTIPLTWAAPATGQSDFVPLAAKLDNQLVVVYLQAGSIVSYQPVIQLEQDLIGLPAFTTDLERHLTLAWSVPVSVDEAALQWTTTRPLN